MEQSAQFGLQWLADKYLQPYQLRGAEIVPALCPFCHGGDHGDTRTFSLNIHSGLYCCQRGSCGARGRLDKLMQHFGEAVSGKPLFSRPAPKQYTLPKIDVMPITEEIQTYFQRRKISIKTLETYRVGADRHGNIVFPFYREDVLTYAKFRRPHKTRDKESKEWQTPGACPILFGMDLCAFSQPLIITEGQIDALSLAEAGITNVVSVPSGCSSLEWIEHCWEWLDRFDQIILYGDADAPGQKMIRDAVKRLDESRCAIVDQYPARPEGGLCKDANEVLYFHGPQALVEAVANAQPIPIKGVIQLADVIPYDPTLVPRIKTMIPTLDEALGGLIEGGLTVFTGKPGDGKSTLAGLLLLNAIEQGHSVCAYSGELTKERFQEWIHYQAAGSEYIGLKHDPIKGKEVPYVSYPVRERIMDYYRDKFFLFDNNAIFDHNQTTAIVQVFTMVARRYGCKLFLVDNLMTSLSDEDEENRAQGVFTNTLKKFAVRYDVHVLLVAHPRKSRFGESLKQDDIAGNSATIRLADSAIVVERPNLRILKNRDGGVCKLIECCYCADSRRIYQADKGDLNAFSWDKEGITPADPRANSLEEYGIQFAEIDPF